MKPAKAAEVTKIQGLIQSLNAEVARTQAEAKVASDIFYEAQQAFFFAQARRADELQAQADEKPPRPRSPPRKPDASRPSSTATAGMTPRSSSSSPAPPRRPTICSPASARWTS